MKDRELFTLSDWYILQIRADRTEFILDFIKKVSGNDYTVLHFTKEVIHHKQGRRVTHVFPLFPGFIFVHKAADEVHQLLRDNLANEFVLPISFNGRPARVYQREMEWLLDRCDADGKIGLSQCRLKKGGIVEIVQGPLKNFQGKILFINKKKQKAKVEVSLFNRQVHMSLGLDLIKEVEMPSPSP